ncbi:reverse transcriptase domain-containing protein [Tanacetum coccineum]
MTLNGITPTEFEHNMLVDLSPLRPFCTVNAAIISGKPSLNLEQQSMLVDESRRADEANIENWLRDSRWADNRHGQSYRDTSRRPKDRHITCPNERLGERSNTHRPSFTPLLKSPAEIYATSEGRSFLRPPSRMFAPAHSRDHTRYWRNSFEYRQKGKDHVDWKQRIAETKAINEVLMTDGEWSQPCHESRTSQLSTIIAFSNDDPIPEHSNGDNPLIIKAGIGGCMIHRIYVDGGSSIEIMYEHCFQQLSNEAKALIRAPTSPLVGFASQVSWPLEIITASLTLFDYNGKGSKTIMTDFMIVRASSPYNVILGRPGMRQLGAIASTVHSLIKFPIQSGVAVVRGDILCKIECAQISRKRVRESDTKAISETQEKHAKK